MQNATQRSPTEEKEPYFWVKNPSEIPPPPITKSAGQNADDMSAYYLILTGYTAAWAVKKQK